MLVVRRRLSSFARWSDRHFWLSAGLFAICASLALSGFFWLLDRIGGGATGRSPLASGIFFGIAFTVTTFVRRFIRRIDGR